MKQGIKKFTPCVSTGITSQDGGGGGAVLSLGSPPDSLGSQFFSPGFGCKENGRPEDSDPGRRNCFCFWVEGFLLIEMIQMLKDE